MINLPLTSVAVSPAGVNGGYYQGGALPVQQAHSTTPHEVPHTVAPSSAAQPQTPQPQPPAGPVIPPHLVSMIITELQSPAAAATTS